MISIKFMIMFFLRGWKGRYRKLQQFHFLHTKKINLKQIGKILRFNKVEYQLHGYYIFLNVIT